jgi:antitoxin HicB
MNNEKATELKPLSFYLKLNYPITFYPDDDGGFTVAVKDLPGCITQGDTAEEAFEMIAEARELWLEVAHEYGDPIPMPSTEVEYSGKTMLRMPKYLHARLAESAKREGVSLNQYLVSLLSERDTLTVIKAVQNELAGIREQMQKKVRSPT